MRSNLHSTSLPFEKSVSRHFGLNFQNFYILCFKTTICFNWFNVSRPFLSFTHKKLFAFSFIFLTSTPLYAHAHNPSCHLISNTLRQKRCHLPSTFQRHLHNFNIAVPFNPNPYEKAMTKEGAFNLSTTPT